MRTVLVERGVVTVEQTGTVRIASASAAATPSSERMEAGRARPSTQSEAEYFDRLSSKCPNEVEPLKAFLASLGEVGISPEFRRSVVLRFYPSPDMTASAGYIDVSGAVHTLDGVASAERAGSPESGRRYLEAIAAATGGTIHEHHKSDLRVVSPNGLTPNIAALLAKSEAWKGAIARLVDELRATAAA